MSKSPEDRRRHQRHRSDPAALRVRFSFPDQRSRRHEAALRDLSVSGISFLLDPGHPELAVGDTLRAVELEILGSSMNGEVVVMHFMRRGDGTGHCGGLFFPADDEDLLAMRRVCGLLEEAAGQEKR